MGNVDDMVEEFGASTDAYTTINTTNLLWQIKSSQQISYPNTNVVKIAPEIHPMVVLEIPQAAA